MRYVFTCLLLVYCNHSSWGAAIQILLVDSQGRFTGTLESDGGRLMVTQRNGEKIPFGSCEDEQVVDSQGPGGAAVSVKVRNCGATVDFATRIGLKVGSQTSDISIFEGRPNITVEWDGPSAVHIHHSEISDEQVYRRETLTLGVAITYVADLKIGPKSQYVDFSSYNYGATGTAAGMPKELLLRAAGWCQEASGLYRAEWDSWAGSPPYGDDPQGSKQILAGVMYGEEFNKRQH